MADPKYALYSRGGVSEKNQIVEAQVFLHGEKQIYLCEGVILPDRASPFFTLTGVKEKNKTGDGVETARFISVEDICFGNVESQFKRIPVPEGWNDEKEIKMKKLKSDLVR